MAARRDYHKARRDELQGFEGTTGTREHCAPYDETNKADLNQKCIPEGEEIRYEVVGGCECPPGTCEMKAMLKNKYMPWTRFPTKDGLFHFGFWKNPYACRNAGDVKKQIGYDKKPKAPKENWSDFWYAVAILHKWVTHEIELDDEDVKKHTFFLCLGDNWNQDDVRKYKDKKTTARKNIKNEYFKAGLLDMETISDWALFRESREDLELDESRKDKLMHFLLNERRNAVQLFEKMDFLEKQIVWQGNNPTIARLDDLPLCHHKIDQETLQHNRNQEQETLALDFIRSRRCYCTEPNNVLCKCREQKCHAEWQRVWSEWQLKFGDKPKPMHSTAALGGVAMLLKCLQELYM